MRALVMLVWMLAASALGQLPGIPGILDPAGLPEQPSSGSVTYLLNETFDSTGYDVAGWAEASTSEIKEDYTTSPSPLSGTQSLYFDVTATRALDSPAFAGQDTVWVSFLFHDDEASLPGGTRAFLAIKDSVGGTTVASLTFETDGDITVACGTANNRSTDSLARNTTYRIWVSYTKGTGANGQTAVYWSTTLAGPKGAAKAAVTTGTSTAQAVSVRFVGYTDLEWHLDDVLIATAEL